MKTLHKSIKWMLWVLTLLIIGYLLLIFVFHDKAFYLNEEYKIYMYIQIVHVILSASVLFIIWSSNLFDRWKKIDQTLIVVFLSVIGLWIWYSKYFKIYKDAEEEDEYK